MSLLQEMQRYGLADCEYNRRLIGDQTVKTNELTGATIISMAREAGCTPFRSPEYWDDVQVFATPDVLERFAELVAAAEREACAKLCDENTNPNADKYAPVGQYEGGCYITAEYLAAAIRARSNHEQR